MTFYLLIGVLGFLAISMFSHFFSCASTLPVPTCVSSAYRNQIGQCNNIDKPNLGAAMTPFRRLKQHKDINVASLSNAREVSRELFPQNNNQAKSWNQSPGSSDRTVMASQFMTHDIALTWHEGGTSGCKGKCFESGTNCYGIPINANDRVFNARGISCIPMKRATRCKLTTASSLSEQVNIATSYIDASHIYGNNQDELRGVRGNLPQPYSHLLTVDLAENSDLQNLLPPSLPSVFCRSPDHVNMPCFYTGDFQRNNVSPEHNRSAKSLKGINEAWDGEKIFQETRKIIGAMMQHITYKEYLPTILSQGLREEYDLVLASEGNFYSGYDTSVDPSVSNSFATAALGFGQSTVGNTYKRGGSECARIPVADLHNPTLLYEEYGIDGILKEILQQSARKIDRLSQVELGEDVKSED